MGRQVVGLVLRFAVAAVAIAAVDGYAPAGYAQPMAAVVLVTLGVGLIAGAPDTVPGHAGETEGPALLDVSRALGHGQGVEVSGDAKAMIG